MNLNTKYVGMDVSKETIAVAIADEGRGEPRFWGTIPHRPEAVRKLLKQLGSKERLEVCYEAGPTGYELYRWLTSMGVSCMVVAPSLIPKRAGDRIKTDRRDAVRLAQLLRAGELTTAWNYRHRPAMSIRMQRKLQNQSLTVQAISWKAQHRLHERYFRLVVHRGKNKCVAATAVARELLGFVWAIACEVEQKKVAA